MTAEPAAVVGRHSQQLVACPRSLWTYMPVLYIHECPACHLIFESQSITEWCEKHKKTKRVCRRRGCKKCQ